MSIPVKMPVSCPKCKRSFQVTAYRSVNTDLRRDLPEQIISGKFFEAPCPRCGFVAHLEYNVLYNDLKHRAMIWVISPNSPTYESDLGEARVSLLATRQMGGKVRIVNDITSLREKVACLESGRDDRIIELYKYVLEFNLAQQQPDERVEKSFYTSSRGKEVFFFYTSSGQEYHVDFPEDGYRIIESKYTSKINSFKYDPVPIIDREWVHKFLSDADLDDEETEDEGEEEPAFDSSSRPPIRFCRKCGSSLLPDSEFCSNCGTRVLR